MFKNNPKNFWLALFSVLTSGILIFVNWFLVDPFHIKSLSTPLRYGLTAAGSLLLGWVIFRVLRFILPVFSKSRLPWILLTYLLVSIPAIFIIPLDPTTNTFSASVLEISVKDQPVPVQLQQIQAGNKTILFNQCNFKGGWQDSAEPALTAPAHTSGVVNCILNEPASTPIKLFFGTASQKGQVQVRLDSQQNQVDLSPSTDGVPVLLKLSTTPKIGYSLVYLIKWIDAVVLLTLILGVLLSINLDPASKTARWLARLNEWFDETTPRFRALALLASLLSFLLVAGLILQPVLSSKSILTIQPGAPQARPNIIFIVVDALAANDMSMFGYPLPTTPNLEKITQTWSVYANNQSPQTCTVAALPTFMSGRYPYTSDFASYGDKIDAKSGWLNLSSMLKDDGYQTWWNGYISPGFYHLNNGFDHSICRSNNPVHTELNRTLFNSRAIPKSFFPFVPYLLDQMGVVTEESEDFTNCEEIDTLANVIQSGQVAAPFFAYYHYRGVHGIPYPSGDHLGQFLPITDGMDSNAEHNLTGEGYYASRAQPDVDNLQLRYAESIADQDQKLAAFIDGLKKKNLYDSSMIVITSDHGQSFNNNFTTHCTPLISYAEAHVPLLVKYPGQTQGQRYDFLTSTLDITPTILETVGFGFPSTWVDGVSLLQQAGHPDANRLVYTRRITHDLLPATEYAVTDGRYRLVRRADKMLLFDIVNDPLEKSNLLAQAGNAASAPEFQRLKQGLENYYSRAQQLSKGVNILSTSALQP
jgi:arylsulfatase A-like enzyme